MIEAEDVAKATQAGVGGEDAVAGSRRGENRVGVFTARTIVTMDAARPEASAVAVQDGRIVGVGSLESVTAALGSTPFDLDETFADHVLVPGLIDQHVHPFLGSLTLSVHIISMEDWVLPDGTVPAAAGPDEYRNRLRAALAADEGNGVFYTWGFHHYFHGELSRRLLDELSPERPVVVWHRSAHEMYLNTAALAHFGVDAAFVEALPASAREQADFEAGHFWEQGVFPVFERVTPDLASADRMRNGLEFFASYLHAAGVTAACEPGGVVSEHLQDAQNAVLGRPEIPFRFFYIPDGKMMAELHLDGDLIGETRKLLDWGTERTPFLDGQVKLFADGAIFSQAMQLRDGYLDGHAGVWMTDPDRFARSFAAYWDAGYQIHIHQNGDAGLDLVLDCLEQCMARNPRTDHRTTIVHFGFSREDQVDRIARLGAIVSANPYYLTALADRYGEQGIGPERSDAIVRLGEVRRAGIPLSLHSDMPMAPGRPLFLMWCAVNRETVSGRIARPDLRISAEDALRAVTLDAAYSLRQEHELGSIEPGKKANFTVLDDNPLTCDPHRIKDIGVWGTVFEGTVHPAPPRGA
ncbi:MAG: amidohydrolase [Actinobacteria bacterium]|nr:amidohydrolase [Actinomycetota bacterium]